MNNLIIVEGETDKYFIEALIDNQKLHNIEVGEPICTINEFNCLGSKDNLKIKLTDIKLDEYDKIGIVLDADEDGIESRVEFINEALKSVCSDVTLDKINQPKRSDTLDLSIACYIMNVDGKGELETVMRKVYSEDSTYADCLDAWRDCLSTKDISLKDKEFDKIWVSHYLKYDTCKSSKHRGNKNKYCANELIPNTENTNEIENNLKSNKETLSKDIWNFDDSILDELKIFLKLFT